MRGTRVVSLISWSACLAQHACGSCASAPPSSAQPSTTPLDHGVRSTYTMSRAPIFIVVSLSQSFLLDGLSNIDKRTLENIKHRDTNIFPYRGEIHLKKGTRNCFIVHPVYLSLGNEFVKIGQTGEAAQCVQHLSFKRYFPASQP